MTEKAVSTVPEISTAKVSDEVMQMMQFRVQPFNADPGDGDWFVDDTTREQLQVIRTALVTGDDLLLVSGENGSGKTVLLKQFTSSSGARLQCISVRGSDHFVTKDLLVGLLKVFKLTPPIEMSDILKEVIPCLQAWTERNTLGVIVLDDADAVPDGQLSTLLGAVKYLNSGDEVLLRIVFAAQSEFELRIPTLLTTGSDLPYATLAMEPFDIARCDAYLDFRLNQAGNFDGTPFTDKELQSLYANSGGLPARLNEAAAAELNIKYGTPEELLEEATGGGLLQNRPFKMLLGVLGIGLIAAGLYQFLPEAKIDTGKYALIEKKPINAKDTNQIRLLKEKNLREKNLKEKNLIAKNENIVANATTDQQNETATATKEDVKDKEIGIAKQSTTSKQDNSKESEPAVASDGTNKIAAAAEVSEAMPNAATTNSTIAANEGTTKAGTEGGADTDSVTSADSNSDKNADKKAGNNESTTTQINAEESAEKKSTTDSKKSDDANGELESANWVLVQKPEQFTVQLSSSTELDSVKSFLKRSELKRPNSIFSYKQGNNTRYALVHGLFSTISEASAAIEKMNDAARSNQPWIRSMRQLQKSLKNK